MKKDEVKVGQVYIAKVSDKLTKVRIDRANPRGGWDATNLTTKKQVRIKSAQRLRGAANGEKAPAKAESQKKLTDKQRKDLRAQAKADQENARLAEERSKASDGVTASERAMTESAKDKPAPKPRKKREGMSCLDAAAKVLAEAGEPMSTKAMIEAMVAKGYWTSPGGKTPHATLYSAILREIQNKGDQTRFAKVDRGRFAITAAGKEG